MPCLFGVYLKELLHIFLDSIPIKDLHYLVLTFNAVAEAWLREFQLSHTMQRQDWVRNCSTFGFLIWQILQQKNITLTHIIIAHLPIAMKCWSLQCGKSLVQTRSWQDDVIVFRQQRISLKLFLLRGKQVHRRRTFQGRSPGSAQTRATKNPSEELCCCIVNHQLHLTPWFAHRLREPTWVIWLVQLWWRKAEEQRRGSQCRQAFTCTTSLQQEHWRRKKATYHT